MSNPTVTLVQTSGPCIIKGCPETGVCLDSKNYTQRKSELAYDPFDDDEITDISDNRQIWYCTYHAKKHLWPIIDWVNGNRLDAILEDFADDDLL